MKYVIIEDEVNAYEYLNRIISQTDPNAELLTHIDSVEDAVNWFSANEHPDLVFMDIQLSDGISFEIFNHIDLVAPVIFTTAYDQYAIQAFKHNSLDYLLKPVSKDELKKALNKFEHQANGQSLEKEKLNNLVSSFSKKKNRCLVKKGNHFQFIPVKDIAYINSEDSITFLHTKEGARHIYAKTVSEIVMELDEAKFFQINRSQILNIDTIHKIHPFLNQRLKIELSVPAKTDFIVSRNRMMEFKAWVDS